LKSEYDVLVENWNIRSSDFATLRALQEAGTVLAVCCYSEEKNRLWAHHNGVYGMVLKKTKCENANAAKNQTAMISYILRSTDWIERLKRELRLGAGVSWEDIVRGL
jgi:hypothetical protein